nr:proline-rich protein 2 isoform X2 [Oryctolagus cuniculus]XP_051692904.1 proline-rich protein 2 isoform X2 [Oryctolagus cuniculus]
MTREKRQKQSPTNSSQVTGAINTADSPHEEGSFSSGLCGSLGIRARETREEGSTAGEAGSGPQREERKPSSGGRASINSTEGTPQPQRRAPAPPSAPTRLGRAGARTRGTTPPQTAGAHRPRPRHAPGAFPPAAGPAHHPVPSALRKARPLRPRAPSMTPSPACRPPRGLLRTPLKKTELWTMEDPRQGGTAQKFQCFMQSSQNPAMHSWKTRAKPGTGKLEVKAHGVALLPSGLELKPHPEIPELKVQMKEEEQLSGT